MSRNFAKSSVNILSLLAILLVTSIPFVGLRPISAQEPPMKLVLFGLPGRVPADGGNYQSLVVGVRLVDGSTVPLPKEVIVTLSSANKAVGDVDRTVTIPPGEFFTFATFRSTLSPGKTVITASSEGLSVGSITVETVKPAGSPARLAVFLAPDTLPAWGESTSQVIVQLFDATGVPAEARANTSVSLSSSQNAIGNLPDNVVIPEGKSFVTTKFVAGNLLGSTVITASASGFSPGSATISVVGTQPSKLAVFTAPKKIALGREEGLVTIQLQDTEGTPAKSPADLRVQILVSDSTIGSTDSEVVIPKGSSSVQVKFTSLSATGKTRITALAPELTSGFGEIEVVRGTTVAKSLQVHFLPNLLLAEKATHRSIVVQRVSGDGSPAVVDEPTSVLLMSSRPFFGSVSPRVTIPAGRSFVVAEFNSTFLPGRTDITATAENLNPVTGNVTTSGPQPSQLAIRAVPPVFKATGEAYDSILVGVRDPKGMPSRAPEDITVILTSSRPEVGTVQSVVLVPQGKSYTFVRFASTTTQGQTIITATSSGYLPVSTEVRTVEPYPSKLTLSLAPNPLMANERAYNTLVIELQDGKDLPADPREPVQVILHSSNPDVGKVPGNVTIPKGRTYFRIPFQTTKVPGDTTLVALSPGFTVGILKVSTFALPTNVGISMEPKDAMLGNPSRLYVSVSTLQGVPVKGATLLWSTNLGNLAPESNATDADGKATAVLVPLRAGNGTVSVSALKPGFQVGSFPLQVKVKEPERPAGTPQYVLIAYAALTILPAGLVALWFFKLRRRKRGPLLE